MNEDNLRLAFQLVPIELWNTLYMVLASSFLALLIGMPLGIVLTITRPGHLKENRIIYHLLSFVVNIGRSLPFAILIVSIIPLTRFLVGTSLGTTAAIVPLTIAAIPFIARQVECSLREVDMAVIEAAIVMGSTTYQIVRKILIPEALSSLVLGTTTMIINLIGYSAMAGAVGGGGLGKIAIQYGYQRFNIFLMVVTIVLLIVVVQVVQWVGNRIAKEIDQKRGRI